MKISFDDTLNIAYVLKNFFLHVHKVEPFGCGEVETFYFDVSDYKVAIIDKYEIFSVNKILHEIGYSIRVEDNKLIIEKE